jgi:hypothetical protein
MLSKYESWLQMAKSGEVITYHEGYLGKDRFYDYSIRDIANLFMRAYENKIVDLFQKRVEYGNINHDPKFQYIAKKL